MTAWVDFKAESCMANVLQNTLGWRRLLEVIWFQAPVQVDCNQLPVSQMKKNSHLRNALFYFFFSSITFILALVT